MKDNNVYIDKDNLKYIILRKRENSIKVLRLDILQILWFTKSFFKTNFIKYSKFIQINMHNKYFHKVYYANIIKPVIFNLNIDKRFNKINTNDVIILNFIKNDYSVMVSIESIKIFYNLLNIHFKFIMSINNEVKRIMYERQQYL